jgi:hypothetical protein
MTPLAARERDMDDAVKLAMAKWPNVPHCYGWLALDARGHWRMRDERAQTLALPGDKLTNPALLGFINRNYAGDERGCWFFQNGPQRVYVDLEAAPFVARTDPALGFVVQTGAPLAPEQAWLTPAGRFLLQGQGMLAALDDRDAGACMARLTLDGTAADDEALLAWLEERRFGRLALVLDGLSVPVERIADAAVAGRFGFVTKPRA